MQPRQLPMFGITLIAEEVKKEGDRTGIRFRRAATDEWWTMIIGSDYPAVEQLSRPGAVFALVELASVGQVESRGRF